MKPTLKRRLAKFFMEFLGLSTLIRKLQPIAAEVFFGEESRSRVDEIRSLLRTQPLPASSFMRIGDSFDGGYVLFNRIRENSNCISVGVGTNISFDVELSNFVNEVHLYDHTVPGLPQFAPHNVKYFKQGLGVESIGQFLNLQDCVDKWTPDSNIILKMDIEGAEWEILSALDSETLLRFDQIAIEFHDFFKIRELEHFRRIVEVLSKLNKSHSVVNLHANNWGKYEIVSNVPFADVLEVTYVSKLIIPPTPSPEERHNYNKACNPLGPEIELAF
jgi:hypothetical protein